MRKIWSIPGLLIVSLILSAVVLPMIQGSGAVVTAIQMDRSSGDKRRVLQIFDSDVFVWSDAPMWFAEYATEHRGEWVTVHRKTGRHGARENWRWGGVHATLRVVGDSLQTMEARDDVRMAVAEELLRLIRSEDHPEFLREVINDALMYMWEQVDAGASLSPDDVQSAFRDAEARARSQTGP
jgi:hypothetical protein